LATVPFAEIERQLPAGTTFRIIKTVGVAHPLFVSLNHLVATRDPALWEVRGFLYNVVGLNELYAGDGFIYGDEYRGRTREFLVLNRRIEQIAGCELVDL
jgi:hypothetical protein